MTEEEFRLLRDVVYQHCGLHFTPDSKYLLEKRLSKRLHMHSLKSFKDYYYLLRYGQNRDPEMAEVVDALTTNETYFFREDFQLKTLVQEILPEICERKAKSGDCRLRIWSAGCSTGEEPYTIAMLLLEQPMLQDWSIDIVGTDISQRVLQIARKGVYGLSSFRSTDSTYLKRYFSETETQDKYRISDDVKKLVTISHLNLFDTPRVALLGKMDIVFCRNVIIYFDHAAKKKVIDSFYQRLRPEGFLLLGHSESLMNLSTDFLLRHFTHDMVYQRPPVPSGMEAE
ncbi:MAG TPA: protein-glutamate O-methyltransferase CheR [Desulfuromonadales bacterium]|nr:protein-glutamate O-methyltransferase CheR [Desulfuromonadales bacterium]